MPITDPDTMTRRPPAINTGGAPSAAPAVVRDPEEIAIALLSSELGARRLDPPA